MQPIKIKDFLEIVDGKLVTPGDTGMLTDKEIKNVAIDSRKVDHGSLFVAFKGERVDAHRFVPGVAGTVAACLIEEPLSRIEELSEKRLPVDGAYILVDSTLRALQRYAKYCRSKYTHPVIAVTGSVGKTTTREMITHALESSLSVFHTEKNFNSQIGVALTLIDILDKPSDVAVLELGISERGGMDSLTDMARPNIAVVTRIGVAHIEFMGTREGIRDEKLRIAARMDGSQDSHDVLFLNSDDKLLYEMKGKTGVSTCFYGTDERAEYRAEDIRTEGTVTTYSLVHRGERLDVRLSTPGMHNVLNSVAALAICDYMGLNMGLAVKSMESFVGVRQQISETRSRVTIIDDSYNASPDSMKAAIDVLCNMETGGRRIAVLGDMFELGENSRLYHEEVGTYIASSKVDDLILLGDESSYIGDKASRNTGIRIKHFSTNDFALDYLKDTLREGDIVLIKASNGMKLYDLASRLKNEL